jgi:hypothetical protein
MLFTMPPTSTAPSSWRSVTRKEKKKKKKENKKTNQLTASSKQTGERKVVGTERGRPRLDAPQLARTRKKSTRAVVTAARKRDRVSLPNNRIALKVAYTRFGGPSPSRWIRKSRSQQFHTAGKSASRSSFRLATAPQQRCARTPARVFQMGFTEPAGVGRRMRTRSELS